METAQQAQVIQAIKVKRERTVYFTNILDEEFKHTWNGQVYTFKPKKTYKLEFYKANLFAKVMENVIFNKKGLSVIDFEDENDMPTDTSRKELRDKIIVGDADNYMQEVKMEEVQIPVEKLVDVEEVKMDNEEEISEEFKDL